MITHACCSVCQALASWLSNMQGPVSTCLFTSISQGTQTEKVMPTGAQQKSAFDAKAGLRNVVGWLCPSWYGEHDLMGSTTQKRAHRTAYIQREDTRHPLPDCCNHSLVTSSKCNIYCHTLHTCQDSVSGDACLYQCTATMHSDHQQACRLKVFTIGAACAHACSALSKAMYGYSCNNLPTEVPGAGIVHRQISVCQQSQHVPLGPRAGSLHCASLVRESSWHLHWWQQPSAVSFAAEAQIHCAVST